MNKTILDQFTPLLFIGLMVLLAAGAAWYAWGVFNPPGPDVSAESPEAIAKYKEWLRDNDLPFVGGKIKPADLPAVYGKVIDHDVKTGDLKSGRSFIAHAMQKKLDAPVLEQTKSPEARELIGQMQNARRKVELLRQIVTAMQKKEPGLAKLADEFGQVPFSPTACPEQAEEIAAIYRANLLPLKGKDEKENNEAVQKVIAEIEKTCLPAKKP